MADETDPKQQERIDVARRRLLRNVVYVPPAVIGAVSLMQGCAPGSCAPSRCNPGGMCRPTQCRPNMSDARLKRDIAPICDALELVARL
jgi:hypothetical protein